LTPPAQIHPPRSEIHFGDHHSTTAKPPPRYNPTMASGASGLSSPSGPTPETRTEQRDRGRRAGSWLVRNGRGQALQPVFLRRPASLCSPSASSQITKASCTTFGTMLSSCIHLNYVHSSVWSYHACCGSLSLSTIVLSKRLHQPYYCTIVTQILCSKIRVFYGHNQPTTSPKADSNSRLHLIDGPTRFAAPAFSGFCIMVATLLVYFGFSLSVTHKLNRWHVFPTKKMCMYVTPCW
jgi:hypothetical protein